MDTTNYMIIVYGPTGVGKTAFVDELTQTIPAEIINLDMGQLYTPLTIGTAKPDWQSASIPHHLFDVIDKPKQCTVVAYRALVEKTMREVWRKNNIPILVGGSAFYLKSLFFPPISSDVKEFEIDDADDLWEQLHTIDPDRAQKIPKQDTYRIKRALALYKSTGKKPSEFMPVYDPPAQYLLLCLTRDRSQLYQRIDERVVQMMDAGWLDEVKQFLGTEWEPFILEKKIIGYDDLIIYLQKKNKPFDELVAAIQKRTRNYAKRQMTFWRMLKRQLEDATAGLFPNQNRIEEVNLTCTDLHLYIKQLQKTVKSMLARE